MKRLIWEEKFVLIILRLLILLVILFLFSLLLVLCVKGGKVLSLSFLFDNPRRGMTEGGIFPAILGSFYLSFGSILIAFPLGLFSGIYLSEFAKRNWLTDLVISCVNALAGVPSVVFGLFGLSLFVNAFGFGISIISGVLTLSLLILPVIVKVTEESIKAVSFDLREAAYALGASKWRTIGFVLLPVAMPNILTGVILTLGRAAGETAPIMFTAVTFYTRRLPTSIFDEVMALPYLIYGLMTEGTKPEKQVPIAFGSALVLLLLVLSISAIGIYLRYRWRGERKTC
ncbi:MAG: phosphate ABC transporter permease PstA [Synergistetes bacterium]|uniref:Phosphate transport system permease protein PstA n=1 Tax=Thermotoga petrophila TaxID=93929 RepID=A0A101ER25_9THEM|nr:MAG: Phosphate ABC transporter permease protein [Thermotoga petrophila]MBC7332064.1 phosphate ABC transporter permease PstA [Synergistota bacterium]MDK2870927.1 phosphate transport system permease protein [bacterium]